MQADSTNTHASTARFIFYDVADFPIVRISGRNLPRGYGPQWVAEMEALLARDQPFAFIFLDSVEDPDHEDQKMQMIWLKRHRRKLAACCRGAVAIEPDRARRLLKRAQGLAMVAAFGLRFSVVRDRTEAEQRARSMLLGEIAPDDGDE